MQDYKVEHLIQVIEQMYLKKTIKQLIFHHSANV